MKWLKEPLGTLCIILRVETNDKKTENKKIKHAKTRQTISSSDRVN